MQLDHILLDLQKALGKKTLEQKEILDKVVPLLTEYRETVNERAYEELYRHAVKSPTWTY